MKALWRSRRRAAWIPAQGFAAIASKSPYLRQMGCEFEPALRLHEPPAIIHDEEVCRNGFRCMEFHSDGVVGEQSAGSGSTRSVNNEHSHAEHGNETMRSGPQDGGFTDSRHGGAEGIDLCGPGGERSSHTLKAARTMLIQAAAELQRDSPVANRE